MIKFTKRGFFVSCLNRDLISKISSLRRQYGEAVIYWGRDTKRH